MEGAPNIQPVTILMLLAGAHLGSRHGVALAVLVTLVSNIFLGSGWWTIWQASGWAMVAVTGALASNWLITDGRLNMWRVASLGLAWGFLFDDGSTESIGEGLPSVTFHTDSDGQSSAPERQ